MLSYFNARKEEIAERLGILFEGKAEELGRVTPLGRDLCERLSDFVLRGKMIRGGLVTLGYAAVHGQGPAAERREVVVSAGAAMELLQSGLLVHDDIMDRDRVRRGLSSVFHQYAGLAEADGIADAYHLGESLGICAGDVAYFLAFETLGRLELPPPVQRQVLSLTARELGYVGVAQMQDIYTGAARSAVREEDVLKLYLYKTGRYTFSLPLMVGGLIAGAPPEVVSILDRLGESYGIIFQIKDDEIGLFGAPEETGKPVGSDIREGKKTLYYAYLQQRASGKDLERLRAVFGNPGIGEEEVEYVRGLTERLGIRGEVQARADQLAHSLRVMIDTLGSARPEERAIFLALLDYSLSRTR
jgi:geranylgeranyl diphosphate synthase type I